MNTADKLSIGFSPCPNDTFIFDALVNDPDFTEMKWEVKLEDVETLNLWAKNSVLDVTKLSYRTYLQVVDQYVMLPVGSALGRGVGPLLITKDKAVTELSADDLQQYLVTARIAIPGVNTTANLLLSLAFPKAKVKQELVFSEIENAVISGQVDVGLIIHENRFTYQDKGLHCIIDLGSWWEKTFQLPIPLGGIAVKRSLPLAQQQKIAAVIKASLHKSWNHYPTLSPFVTTHAQEMEEAVMRKHIELYVNDFTTDLGNEGKIAIQKMFELAYQNSIITEIPPHLFVD